MLPGLGDPVERVSLDVERDPSRDEVLEQLEIGAVALFFGHREVRVALDEQLLAAHVGRAQGSFGPCRLPDVHDPRTGRSVRERTRRSALPRAGRCRP